jgi:hypothetical protein
MGECGRTPSKTKLFQGKTSGRTFWNGVLFHNQVVGLTAIVGDTVNNECAMVMNDERD